MAVKKYSCTAVPLCDWADGEDLSIETRDFKMKKKDVFPQVSSYVRLCTERRVVCRYEFVCGVTAPGL
jgi:hypothetical protein